MEEPNNMSDAIRIRIKNLAKEKNISVHKLSVISGIPYSTVSSFLIKRCKSLTVGTLYALCKGLNVTLKEFFNDKMFNKIKP